jgi:vesicle transport protein SEC22
LEFAVLDDKAANLAVMSKKYKEDARHLNLRSTYMKIAAVVVVIVFGLLFFRFRFW